MFRLLLALSLALLVLPARAEATAPTRLGRGPAPGPSLKPVGIHVPPRVRRPIAKTLAKAVRGHSPRPEAMLDDLIDEPSDSEDDDPDSPGFADDPDDRESLFAAEVNGSNPIVAATESPPRFAHDPTPGPRE